MQGKTAMDEAAGNAEMMQMLSKHGDCREALSSEASNALFAICCLRRCNVYLFWRFFWGICLCNGSSTSVMVKASLKKVAAE